MWSSRVVCQCDSYDKILDAFGVCTHIVHIVMGCAK